MRLDRELKEAGDAALAELGLTPSTAVRALWEQASKRGEGIEAMAPYLTGTASALRLLLCGDVWAELLAKRGSDDAHALLAAAQEVRAELLYPASAVQGVFATLGGGEEPEDAWRGVDRMRELGTAVGMDEQDLALACRLRSLTKDLEASMALAAAQHAKADYLVTFDEELLKRSTVAALSPRDMCTVLEAQR